MTLCSHCCNVVHSGGGAPVWNWRELMKQAEDLAEVSAALNREAAIRSVMKIREVGREQAAKIVDGEKL